MPKFIIKLSFSTLEYFQLKHHAYSSQNIFSLATRRVWFSYIFILLSSSAQNSSNARKINWCMPIFVLQVTRFMPQNKGFDTFWLFSKDRLLLLDNLVFELDILWLTIKRLDLKTIMAPILLCFQYQPIKDNVFPIGFSFSLIFFYYNCILIFAFLCHFD